MKFRLFTVTVLFTWTFKLKITTLDFCSVTGSCNRSRSHGSVNYEVQFDQDYGVAYINVHSSQTVWSSVFILLWEPATGAAPCLTVYIVYELLPIICGARNRCVPRFWSIKKPVDIWSSWRQILDCQADCFRVLWSPRRTNSNCIIRLLIVVLLTVTRPFVLLSRTIAVLFRTVL